MRRNQMDEEMHFPQMPEGFEERLAELAKGGGRPVTTVEEWLKKAKERIPALDAELMLLRALGRPNENRAWCAAHGDEGIYPLNYELASQMLEMRAEGMPLAYLLQSREFYGRDFIVGPEVLIPRPETESLIELVKDLGLSARARILEIGTGSGCIAITLALELPQTEVTATDISMDALEMAQMNDDGFEGRVDFLQSDLFEAINWQEDGPYDVVVANLPYVNPKWEWLDLEALGYEPKIALFVEEENGLALYRRFFFDLREAVTTGAVKYAVVEADPSQHAALTKLAEANGWKLRKTEGYGLAFEAAR